jgi:peroxiredoxin Q/BCP
MLDQPVPDFSLPSTAGTFSLAAQRGTALVIYFYPKDNTPGCTTEAQQFRDLDGEFKAIHCAVYGVSRDSLKSHESFKAKFELPFELLVDSEEIACNIFDVVKMKNMYGKQVRGIERSTFLIDAKGVLRRQWRGVKVPGHAAEVLEAVKSL